MVGALGKARGIIYNIQRFSLHDGEGIRTIIFMKGCPLRCQWCCNPESQDLEPEVLFLSDKCMACQNCIKCCPMDFLKIDRDKCKRCGLCAQGCPTSSKRMSGEYVTVNDLLKEVEKDRVFYRNSNGGVTISGGEPTMQHEFTAELLRQCHLRDVNTAIETCGYTDQANLLAVLEHVNEIFFDIKHMDASKHMTLTGVSNETILDNARKTAELGKTLTFRIPLIPDCNDSEENIMKTGEFVSSITKDHVFIEILPYHNLGEMKFVWLDKEYELHGAKAPSAADVDDYNRRLMKMGCNVVKSGIKL